MADDKTTKDPRGGPRPKTRADDRRGANFKTGVDKNGKPFGNQPHEPREEYRALVRKAAADGQTQDIIARRINVSVATLNRHYHDDWQEGADEMLSGVSSKSVELALGGNVAMLIFLMKSRLGYKTGITVSGPDNKPIDVNVNFDIGESLDQFDDDTLSNLEALLESARKQTIAASATQQSGDDSI